METQNPSKNPVATSTRDDGLPIVPRRALFASALSALAAGATILTVWSAGLDAPATDTFQFSRNTAFSSGEMARLKGFLTTAARDQRYAIVVIGHTGQQGDPGANMALSEARALAAADVARSMGIAPDRITTTGVAGADPIEKTDGQSDRAFQSSLARVDVTLRVQR